MTPSGEERNECRRVAQNKSQLSQSNVKASGPHMKGGTTDPTFCRSHSNSGRVGGEAPGIDPDSRKKVAS